MNPSPNPPDPYETWDEVRADIKYLEDQVIYFAQMAIGEERAAKALLSSAKHFRRVESMSRETAQELKLALAKKEAHEAGQAELP